MMDLDIPNCQTRPYLSYHLLHNHITYIDTLHETRLSQKISSGLHQKDLTVELLEDRGSAAPGASPGGPGSGSGDRPRVKWKADSELWEVRLPGE